MAGNSSFFPHAEHAVRRARWWSNRVARGSFPPSSHRLVGLAVKASASGEEDPEFGSRLRGGDFFSGPCQAPGVVGSLLGLVGPVSVC